MDLKARRKIGRIIGLIIIIIMFLAIIISYIGPNSKFANTIKVDYLDNIPEPIQSSATGSSIFKIGKTDVKLNYLAKYVTVGRVVETFVYVKYKTSNSLGPMDIGMSWGNMAKDKNHEKISYSMIGDRRVRYLISDANWLDRVGGINQVGLEIANVHVIPATPQIEKKIKKIVEDDYIKLEGYLVGASYKKNNGTYTWNSSLTRLDSGDGACEVMYVTDIKWLKNK